MFWFLAGEKKGAGHSLRRWGLAVLLLALGQPVAATHIVGGQLHMEYVRPAKYTIGLTVYFDDVNGSSQARDPDVTLAIYEKGTNNLVQAFSIRLTSQQPVAYSDPLCQLSSLRTSQLLYQTDVIFDLARYTSPRGYYLVWERCCRNVTITNIRNPGAMGQTFYLEFPAFRHNGLPFVNSSPTAFEPVRDFACVGRPFTAAFGGLDPDGDSLVYDMVVPLRGNSDTVGNFVRPIPPLSAPYRRIQWMPGFDSTHQITGPQPLAINRRTGELTMTASQPGLYVFAVRCTEYRNGRRLGEVRREFQELVTSCPTNTVPTLTATVIGPPRQAPLYQPGTVMLLPDPPADRCLSLYAVDGEANSVLTLAVIAPPGVPVSRLPRLSLTGGTVNPGNRRDTLVARLCFDECFGREGDTLRIGLVLQDEACPEPQRDTVWLAVRSRAVIDQPPTIVFPDPATGAGYEVRGEQQLSFLFTGLDPDPATRVTVRGANLTTGALAGFAIRCPRLTGDNTATTRLTWDIACNTPPGDYLLRLEALSEACERVLTTQTEVRVRVLPPDTTVVPPPNVITPNADGYNDAFQPGAAIAARCGETFRQVRIFNRWGREIFTSPDQQAIWRAEHVSAGLYFYFLEYSDRTYKGWVEVVR